MIKRDNSLDFLLIGDWGNFQTSSFLSDPVFDKMDRYIRDSDKVIDGVLSLGDQIYAKAIFRSTRLERETLMNMFSSRSYLT